MLAATVRTLRRWKWSGLYRGRPATVGSVVKRTKGFEQIGPIHLPLEVKGRPEPIDFAAYYFGSYDTGDDYLVLSPGSWSISPNPLVRISSNCIWAFALASVRCDCRWEFEEAKRLAVDEAGHNALLIFAASQHGKSVPGGVRGHALIYSLGQAARQELVHDAYARNGFEVDYRSYGDIATILRQCGARSIRLLTNSPDRVRALEREGFEVDRVPLEKPYRAWDAEELGVKKVRLGHLLNLDGFDETHVRRYGLDPVDVFRAARKEPGSK